MSLIPLGLVPVKLLPYDDKDELLIVVDAPEGTPLERTDAIQASSLPAAVLRGDARKPGQGSPQPRLTEGFDLEQHVQEIEREYIAEALRKADGVKVKAAELLGMSFRSFRYYMKKYNL